MRQKDDLSLSQPEGDVAVGVSAAKETSDHMSQDISRAAANSNWLWRMLTWPSRMNVRLLVVAAPLVAGIISLFFFCPRYYIFKAIDYPFARFNPEVNRAFDTWQKVQEPFVWLPRNEPINWRMAFPLLAHYLYLPRIVFLTLPFVGCWLTLGVVCHLSYRETKSRYLSFLITAVVATTSWFFVSTGWLAYFDSWYVLGMLVVTFYRSHWAFLAACLVVPWIDERFAIMMPMLLVVRCMYFQWIPNRDWNDAIKTTLMVLLIVTPYIILRAAAVIWKYDPVAEAHVDIIRNADWTERLGLGFWYGLRGAWLLIGCFYFWLCSRRQIVLSLAIFLIPFANLLILQRMVAGDSSRTMSVTVPMVVFGAFLLCRHVSIQTVQKVLMGTLIFNLVTPAEHIVTSWAVPIRYFYTQLDASREPPFFMQPEFHVQRGVVFFQQQKFEEAMKEFDMALEIDPKFDQARLNKAIILTLNKRYDEALDVLDTALSNNQDFPEAYYARGVCREAKNNFKGAVTDYKRALDSPKKDWQFRAETERLYKRLRGVGITPIE